MLAEQANITITQVSKWLATERAKIKKNISKRTVRQNLLKEKKILRDFFIKNQNPEKCDIFHLVMITGKTDKYLSRWFAIQRYKKRNQ